MIAVDTNILVYSAIHQSPWNEQAHECIARLWSGDARWVLPWPCVHEFFAVVTNKKLYNPCLSTAQASALIDEWLSSDSVVLAGEGQHHWDCLQPLVDAAHITGPKIHDAKIAAICLQAGVTTLWTADRDFSLFPDLHCENPFVRRK